MEMVKYKKGFKKVFHRTSKFDVSDVKFKFCIVKNWTKIEAAVKSEAGGDEKLVCFFTWPYRRKKHTFCLY